MSRLTIDEVMAHCRKTCDLTEKMAKEKNMKPEDIKSLNYWEYYQVEKWLKELKEYKDLEEQGLLLRLPCKVGDTIYVIPSLVNFRLNKLSGHSENNRVYEQPVRSVRVINKDSYTLVTCDGTQCVLSRFYKETWFLTREEAEQALEKMKGGADETVL